MLNNANQSRFSEDKQICFLKARARHQFEDGLINYLRIQSARFKEQQMVVRYYDPKNLKKITRRNQQQVLVEVRQGRQKRLLQTKQQYQQHRARLRERLQKHQQSKQDKLAQSQQRRQIKSMQTLKRHNALVDRMKRIAENQYTRIISRLERSNQRRQARLKSSSQSQRSDSQARRQIANSKVQQKRLEHINSLAKKLDQHKLRDYGWEVTRLETIMRNDADRERAAECRQNKRKLELKFVESAAQLVRQKQQRFAVNRSQLKSQQKERLYNLRESRTNMQYQVAMRRNTHLKQHKDEMTRILKHILRRQSDLKRQNSIRLKSSQLANQLSNSKVIKRQELANRLQMMREALEELKSIEQGREGECLQRVRQCARTLFQLSETHERALKGSGDKCRELISELLEGRGGQ